MPNNSENKLVSTMTLSNNDQAVTNCKILRHILYVFQNKVMSPSTNMATAKQNPAPQMIRYDQKPKQTSQTEKSCSAKPNTLCKTAHAAAWLCARLLGIWVWPDVLNSNKFLWCAGTARSSLLQRRLIIKLESAHCRITMRWKKVNKATTEQARTDRLDGNDVSWSQRRYGFRAPVASVLSWLISKYRTMVKQRTKKFIGRCDQIGTQR